MAVPMTMPTYVSQEALLTDQEIEAIAMGLRVAQRAKLLGHTSVTAAVLKEMALVVEKERDHVADWLERHGGLQVDCAVIAKHIRDGVTPDLVGASCSEPLKGAEGHGWAVIRKDGTREYFPSRAAARRNKRLEDRVVDCRPFVG